MGSQASTEVKNASVKEPESFIVYCDEEDSTVTSNQSEACDSNSSHQDSVEIRTSWDSPTEIGESSSYGGSQKSTWSETSRVTLRRSKESSGSSEEFNPSRSSGDSARVHAVTSLVDSAQNFHKEKLPLDPLPEESTNDRRFLDERTNHRGLESHPCFSDAETSSPEPSNVGLGLEQIVVLYCQLTGKPIDQLTQQDTLLIYQLANNPQQLLQQVVPPPVPVAADPYRGISEEEQALLDAYQYPPQAPPETIDPYGGISAEELALLESYQYPETVEDSVVSQPTENSIQLSPEEQALLEKFALPVEPTDPFGHLTVEERAIIEKETTEGSTSRSETEEEIMEPKRENPSFTAETSSFFQAEIHPALTSGRRTSSPNRSSVRSSFADELRHVRPSMDVAGGNFTRPGMLPESFTRTLPSIDAVSRFSGASSQNFIPELPEGFPLTALPPFIPPPPPPPREDVPNIFSNPMASEKAFCLEPVVGLHDRMERLNIIRSSFAAERKSSFTGAMPRGVHFFADVQDTGKIQILGDDFLSELERRYEQLAVIPDDVLVPLSLLCMLWGVVQPISAQDAEATVTIFESKKILRVSTADERSLWILIHSDHSQRLKEEMRPHLPEMHSRLVNLYRQGFNDLALIPDDNYIMHHICYHLVEAGRLEELAMLLRDPIWLETKLRSYGTAPVVADFRLYFSCREDPDLNLMLRAFQISANGSLDHSSLYILKEQMLGRLMITAQENLGIREWYEQGIRECRLAVPYRKSRGMPIHLLPKTPSLEQAGSLQRLILKGHTAGIHKVQLASNGLEVVTASADGSVRLWDMEIGDFVLKMEDHNGPVTCFSLSNDGKILVSGGEDGVAIVYDLPGGIWRHKLCGHTKRINAIAIDPHCRRAVTSSQDMTTRIWSLSQGTCLHVLSDVAGASGKTWEEWAGHHDMAISPDARIVATVDAEFRVRIWMLETSTLTDTLEGHSDWVVSLSFAGDSGLLLTASHDKTLRLWNLWKGYCEHIFVGHRGRINNLKVTDDGRRAVSVSDDAIGIVWNVKEKSKVCELVGHSAWINDAAITQDGLRVITVSGDELGIVWDGQTGEALRILKGHSGEITGVSLSYKGRFAITASLDTTARVWDLSAPTTHLEDYHNGKITKILYHPTDDKIVTIGEDQTILIWDLDSCRCTCLIRCHSNINFAFLVSNGCQLITASGDRCVSVWDMESGECVRKLPPHSGSRLKSIAVSNDGKRAVMVLFDSTVTLWDLETMECVNSLMKRAERDGVHVHAAAVNNIVLTMNGSKAVTVSKDHTARLWDLEANATFMILEGHEDGVDLVSVKEDGSLCMTAGYDKTARLWDLRTGECTMVLDHPKDIDFLAVDKNWTRAVTIADEDTAWLWDIVKGRCLGILESQGDHLVGAVFSPDGRFLATYSSNSVLRVWTATSGKLRGVYLADSGISACQFAGQSEINTLVMGDGNGHVHFLEFPSNELMSIRKKKTKE